ncbi:zinc/manganese transport system ATP-binding protein [Pseudorhodobacter antarcticus]|jgi:zinc/manganese transport system ATP-binding protein|uniref:Zinc/manganese transport system ATP-binding protein n=1 Tax=Pseudorhodobacter antarcticus TaxID=1077947 RepID=A0A1H8LFB1_9RHOB|nr:zinc ABC transporter ATP-binding protein AztA [Pseudorhodobacter antarcticus]SEO03753.1 zinc/manganese transport system ATP-binding protein [Pseudorhodobacter antarcticus]
MPAITFKDLTLGYDRHPAVHHLDAVISSGSLTAVVGPNGAGKSTLLKGMVGALAPLEGSITHARDRIAYLPQQAEIDRTFPLPVRDLVAMGLWAEIGAFGRLRPAHADRIAAALSAVGLTGFERRSIAALSGGQMQRVLFARLLLQEADVNLLDEPFTAIDAKTAADLMQIVHRWHGDGRTVVAVLHDLDAVRAHFPETLVIARELVAHGPTEQVLTAENLFRARQMCEAFDENAAVCLPETRGAA